jgi:hypothetical protein
LEAILDAFQKTAQFNQGLAAIELMRKHQKLPQRTLDLFAAKYLVQKFDYHEAETLLSRMKPRPDRDVILFNILLNLCRDDEARQMLAGLPKSPRELNEFQCVMLRNAAHLYNPDIARELLRLARAGFKNKGLKFGEATTLNNLGVLELWAGRLQEGSQYLLAAQTALEDLNSNEVYQPITNMAILHAMRGQLVSAKEQLQRARMWASPHLRMDDLMLQLNQLVLDLMDGNIRGTIAAGKAIDLYRRSLQTKDVRFQRVLAWFANQLESAFIGSSSFLDSTMYETQVRNNGCVGHEVYCEIDVDGCRITAVLQLSTHWRY